MTWWHERRPARLAAVEPNVQIEELIHHLHSLDQGRCKSELRRFDLVRLDFTDELHKKMSLDRSRHVLLAA